MSDGGSGPSRDSRWRLPVPGRGADQDLAPDDDWMAGRPIRADGTGRPGAVIPSSARTAMHATAAAHARRAVTGRAGAPEWIRG